VEIIRFIGGVTKPISTYSTSNKEVSEKRVERRKSITISEHFVNLLAVPHRRLKLCQGYPVFPTGQADGRPAYRP